MQTPPTSCVCPRRLVPPRSASSEVVTTSTECPRATRPSHSSFATQIAPPNARAGQYAGAAKSTRRGLGTAKRYLSRVDGTSPPGVRSGRPLLLVFNQYYWPAVEATAHLLTELCEGLADEY